MTLRPCIVIDTREQLPLEFSDAVHTRREALPVGDYQLDGLPDFVVIERKSLGDLLSSITHDRERFLRELARMRSVRFPILLVECNWCDFEMGLHGRQVAPAAIFGSLAAFVLRFRLIPVLAGDHQTAAIIAERILCNAARLLERDYKALSAAGEQPDAATAVAIKPRARTRKGDGVQVLDSTGDPMKEIDAMRAGVDFSAISPADEVLKHL